MGCRRHRDPRRGPLPASTPRPGRKPWLIARHWRPDRSDNPATRLSGDMERPPSRGIRSDKTEGLGGRVTAGISPARTGALTDPGAASSQPPHMSISQSSSRTTSLLVYPRTYPRFASATRELSRQRSLRMAASISPPTSIADVAGASALPSSVCTRAASVILETSQTPWAATKSAGLRA